MTNSTTRPCTCGSSKSEWRAHLSGPILCEKAVQLHKKMYGEESSFSGSTGWQWRFCKRHGIRNLSLEGEKLSADTEASGTFITSFNEFVEEHQLTLNQIFNCDETGLNFRLLPNKTLAASFEHSAYGRKLSKECHNQCLCKCYRHLQVTAPGYQKSKMPKVFLEV